MTNSTVSGNSATRDGGGVISGGTLTLLNSTVSVYTATELGGGLHISSGTATLTNSTVSCNLAGENGGGLNNTGTVSNTVSVVGVEPDITPGNNSASSATTINERAVVPPAQGSCNRSACGVPLTCTLGAPCANRRVTLFVPGRTVRLSKRALAKAPARIKFAFGVANIPPGETRPVRLRLTSRAKTLIRTSKNKRIKAVMEIRNTAGTVVSNTPITIRFR